MNRFLPWNKRTSDVHQYLQHVCSSAWHRAGSARANQATSLALAGVFLAAAGIAPALWAGTKEGAVQVTVGEPSVWSLEQAHYLLERLRNRNGRLESAPFTHLDPNAVNSMRFDAVRRLFGATVEYDQTAGAKNRALGQQYQSNLTMREHLEKRWQVVLQEQGENDAALRLARVELAQMSGTANDADRRAKAAEVEALEKNRADIDSRMKVIEQAMGGTGVTPAYEKSGLGGTIPQLPESMDPGVLKSALKRVAEHQPRLDASVALDNHVQFNYELIAKQLTLLRDEVGPGKRILFLELPQSVYGVPGKGDDHLGQSWWRVAGIVRGRLKDDEDQLWKQMPGSLATKKLGTISAHIENANQENLSQDDPNERRQSGDADRYRHWDYLRYDDLRKEQSIWTDNGPVRSVELIPRINSLNVADTHSAVRTSAFSLIGRFLWGLGAQLNYQKQRETFDQFLQQEVYASGHGKGLSQFGWIFGPKPGTKAIAPGVRTTYAVLVVPDDAAYLELTGRGCQYHRKITPVPVYPELASFGVDRKNNDIECGIETRFHVQVPPAEAGFSVSDVDYEPVRSGERATVILRGTDISPQISVMIDGVPLTKVLSLGSPKAWSDEFAENHDAIRGRVEFLNSGELVFAFSMPSGYVGTPKITLVTPTKAYTLNRLRFRRIRGCPSRSRSDCPVFENGRMRLEEFTSSPSRQMFLPGLSISDAKPVSYDRRSAKISISALGRKLDAEVVWLVNGTKTCAPRDQTGVTTRLDCDRPEAYSWQLGAIGHDPQSPETAAYSMSDPFPPLIEEAEVIDAVKETVDKDDATKTTPALASIAFKGKFFNSKQTWTLVSDGKMTRVEIKSTKEAVVSVELKKNVPALRFQCAGTVKDPVEQHTVEITKWR